MAKTIKEDVKLVKLKAWINSHYLQLAVFNIYLIILVLLRSAGYFEPYLPITINLIFMSSLILSVFLLNLSTRASVILAVFFWALAAIFRILNIEVWAERAALYSYESLILSIFILMQKYLSTPKKNKNNK